MISAPLIEYLKKGIFTILGLMLAVYLFVILLTYTSNDPSWSHISSDMTTVNNTGGAMGAWLSDLLYSFFGFGSWWLLAFLIYESILIWWDNKPAFWVLRLVAYVFLILSASALLSQLIAIIKPAAETMTGVKGLAGGIIGTELQLRLATLLTAWGSLLFLVVFVLITMTFAFNIHWTLVYKKLTNLAWLGSGLKNDDDTETATKRSRMQSGKDLIISKITQKKLENTQALVEPTVSHGDNKPSDKAAGQGRFSGVLTEFLAKSGIRESVTATVAASATNATLPEQQASPQTPKAPIKQKSVDNPPLDNTKIKTNSNPNASSSSSSSSNFNDKANANGSVAATNTVATPRKIEPSFAWNDASIVKDLLANQAASEPHPAEIVPANNSFANSVLLNNYDSNKAEENSKAAPSAPAPTSTPASILELSNNNETDFSVNQAPTVAPNEDNVELISSAHLDELADAWLAEHDTLSATNPVTNSITTSNMQSSIGSSIPDTALTTDSLSENKTEKPANINAETETETEPLDVFAAMLSQTSIPENITPKAAAVNTVSSKPAISPEPSTNVANVAEVSHAPIDMTPTNTPPANPTVNNNTVSAVAPMTAPKSEQDTTAVTAAKIQSESTTPIVESPKPTMRFDVPEGDSSNHITDMVPDDSGVDDELDAPIIPEIHDDAAFSKKSRSMQTAAYRAQLSPIPPLTILEKPDPNHQPSYTPDELEQLSELLEIKLQEFNVKAAVVNAIPGPVVTRFEVELAAGVKASKVTGISRDLARSLSMASLRVVEVIPGKPYIGIEVPNKQREMVRLIELLDTDKFKDPKSQISMAMGKDIGGKPIITDLARAPHMLVAGTTGSGKSVLVNAMLLSMLLKYTPDQLRLILIDPKQLELANYNDIPHLLTPVVTDMTEAASSLSWCVAEMERRYFLMSVLKVRKLSDFNKQVRAAEKAGNPMLDPLWRPNDSVSVSQAPKMKTLPMIVIVADEFADMIMQVGKPAEELITRLAQKSRAAGIHLVLATQRPSVDVITGLIKANIPVRAALRVNSKVDSRTILDSGGAEDMLGNGDMLFLGPGQIEPDRVHGAYVSDEEVNNVCDAWRERGAPDYIDNMAGNFELASPSSGSGSPTGEDDDLYNDAVAFVMESRKVSASSIQRKFSIGYNRAARIVDSMEDAGLVSPMGKSGKRELLI